MPAETHQRPSRRLQWPLVLAAGLLIVAVLLGVLAADNALAALATIILDGGLPLLNTLAATLAGLAVVRRLRPDAGRALLVASGAGIGLGVLITLALLLGLAGLLNAATAWLLVGLLGVAGLIDLRLDLDRWRRSPAFGAWSWLWLLPAGAVGIAMLAATMPPGWLWPQEPLGYDVVSYHLQIPREWHDASRIVPMEHNIFSWFPLGQETLFLLLMHQSGGPWDGMYACQLQSLLLMALAVVGMYGALPLAGPLQRTVGAVLLATLPWTIMLGSVAYNEALLILATVLVTAWLLRSLEGDCRAGLLAGLFVGLGLAAKHPGLPMLGAGAIGLVVGWVVRGTGSEAGREAGSASTRPRAAGRWGPVVVLGALFVGAAVFSAPWLLRNVAWIGNPFFPLATGLFGDGGWAPELVERWNRAHALAPGQTRLGRVWSDLILNPRFGFLLLPAAVAAAGWGIARRSSAGVLLVAWLVIMLIVWVGFTHLQGRFFAVAIPPAIALVILASARLRPAFPVALALGISLIGLGWTLGQFLRSVDGTTAPFGVGSLLFATPIEDLEQTVGRRVYLVGDAHAFLYPVERLHYRVVFNVPPAEGALGAWLGAALDEAPDDALVVIDPAEVRRLRNTYGTPPLEIEVGPVAETWTMAEVRQALKDQVRNGSGR